MGDQDWETRDTVEGGMEPRSPESLGQISSEPEVMSKVGWCIDGIRGHNLPGKVLWDVFAFVIFDLLYNFLSGGFLTVIGGVWALG